MKPHNSKGGYGTPPAQERRNFKSDGSADLNGKRRADLKLFFELRDRKYVSIVDELFRLYDFTQIAVGIFRKYRLVPYGWREDLLMLKGHGDPSLNWFDPNRDIYLRETTDNYPGVERRLIFPERKDDQLADRVVDEFIESEKLYFERLQVFMRCYVAEIEAIVTDKVGPEAKQALGLDFRQVEFIFGRTLREVFRATESLLVVLETLCLVQASPRTTGGRPGALAEFMMLSGKTLVEAYGPYNANYPVAKKVLERKLGQCASIGQRNAMMPNGAMRHLDFAELWNEISQSKPMLKAKGIDSVLIEPIRKFPNYKVFFERFLKILPASDPGFSKMQEAHQKVQEFTQQIDQQVKGNQIMETRYFAELMGN